MNEELGKNQALPIFAASIRNIINEKTKLLIVVFILSIKELNAQIDTIWYRSLVLQQVDTNKTIGLVLGISKNDKKYIFSFGRLDKNGETKPDSNTVFEIGGVAKVFTAALSAQLKAQNKISYNDTVFNDKSGKEVLLSQLLTHTSGLPNLPPLYAKHAIDGLSQHDSYNYDDVQNDIKNIVCKENKYLFSQFNYAIIGNYIQKKMNEKFEDLMQKNILEKYHLAQTSFQKNNLFTHAIPYDLKGDKTFYSQPKAMNAALGLRCSMNDLLHFCTVLIQESYYKALFEIQKNTDNKNMKSCYGFHAGKFSKNDSWFYIAKGRTAGFYSFILINPENHFSICILANGSSPLDELAYIINDKLKKK